MSKITIYRGVKFQKVHNFVIDNLALYLSQLPNLTFDKCQFIRTDLTNEIKLPIGTSQLNELLPFIDSFNYMLIENFEGSKLYYFINRSKWGSASSEISTIHFEVTLDVLNSFKDGEAFNFTKRTNVLRKHFERFSSFEYNSILNLNIMRRYIHETNEGLTFTPVNIQKQKIEDTGDLNQNFYLISSTDPNPEGETGIIQVALTTENETKFKATGSPTLFNKSNFKTSSVKYTENNIPYVESTTYWIFFNDYNGLVNSITGLKTLEVENTNVSGFETFTNSDCKGIVLYSRGDVLFLSLIRDNTHLGDTYYLDYNVVNENFGFAINNFQQAYKTTERVVSNGVISPSMGPQLVAGFEFNAGSSIEEFYNSINYEVITTIKRVDRTSPNISSILMIPYAPNDFTFTTETISGDTYVLINPGESNYLMNLENNKLDFKVFTSNFSHSVNLPARFLKGLFFTTRYTPSVLAGLYKEDPLSVEMESKLNHSEFYYQKLGYDNFSMNFNLENYNELSLNYAPTSSTTMNFKVTNSLKSRFLIEIPLLSGNELFLKYIDYEGILISNRNNEIPIYSSSYLDYIRTAYNYDVKNKQIDQIVSWGEMGINLAKNIGDFKSNPLGVVSSTAQNIESNIINEVKFDLNMQQKLTQMALQGYNISGSDDIDLFEYYTENRAYLFDYQIKQEELLSIYNLFFYCGYKCNIFEIPTHNIRNRFDFLQCEADIIPIKGIPQYIIDELKNLFLSGVTYIHQYNNTWDLLQEYNNIENRLLGGYYG